MWSDHCLSTSSYIPSNLSLTEISGQYFTLPPPIQSDSVLTLSVTHCHGSALWLYAVFDFTVILTLWCDYFYGYSFIHSIIAVSTFIYMFHPLCYALTYLWYMILLHVSPWHIIAVSDSPPPILAGTTRFQKVLPMVSILVSHS